MNKQTSTSWEKEVARLACQQIAAETLQLDITEVEISDALEARVQALFDEERARLQNRRRKRRRTIAILIAAVLIALTACMSIPAIREKLCRMVVTYYEQFFSCQTEVTETEPNNNIDNSNVIPGTGLTATASSVVFEKRMPTYLPEGYELYREDSTDRLLHVYFWNHYEETYINYEQSKCSTKNHKVNSCNSNIESVFINGNPGVISIESTDKPIQISLRWSDGIYDYAIDAALPLAEILKIAESIH